MRIDDERLRKHREIAGLIAKDDLHFVRSVGERHQGRGCYAGRGRK